MYYILFFAYLIICCFLLLRIKFIKNSGLSSRVVVSLFLLKVLVGVIYGWININYLKSGDTLTFFQNSIKETDLLFSNPSQYFKDFFTSQYGSYGEFLGTSNSFWNDLRGTLLEKLLSIFNILSFKNYYIDSLLFNFLLFFGPIALYRFFLKIYPQQQLLIIIGVFLIPSTLYFTSGIHKDGLIFLGIGMCVYNAQLLFTSSGKRLRPVIFLLFGLLLLFFIRNFFFMAIIPSLICWWIASKKPNKTLVIFLAVYIVGLVIFFISPYLHPSLNLPEKVCNRQYAFLQMSWAKSYIPTDSLQPFFVSFMKNFPAAVNHVFLRPYPSESYSIFYIAAMLENALLILVLFLFILLTKRDTPFTYPAILFCIFFAVSCFIMIGYTVPIMGAIFRYKSVFLPFVLIPVFTGIKWNKLRLFIIHNENK